VLEHPWDLGGGLLPALSAPQSNQAGLFGMDTTLTYQVTDVHTGYKQNVFIDLKNPQATVAITTGTLRDTNYKMGASYTLGGAANTRTYRFIDHPLLTQSIDDFECLRMHQVCGRDVMGDANGVFEFKVVVKMQSGDWKYIPGDLEVYTLMINEKGTSSNLVQLGGYTWNPDDATNVSITTNTDTITFTHIVTKTMDDDVLVDKTKSPIIASVVISDKLDYFYNVTLGGLTKYGRVDHLSRQHKHYSNSTPPGGPSNTGKRLEFTGSNDAYTIETLLQVDTTITADTHFKINEGVMEDHFKNIGLDDEFLLNSTNRQHYYFVNTTNRVNKPDLLMHNGKYYFPGNNNRQQYVGDDDFTQSLQHNDQNRFILLRYDNISFNQRFVVLKFDTDDEQADLNAREYTKMYMWTKVVVQGDDDDSADIQSLHWNSVQSEVVGNDTTSNDAAKNVLSPTRGSDAGMRVDRSQLDIYLGIVQAGEVQSAKKSVLIDTGKNWLGDEDNNTKYLFVLLVCLNDNDQEFANITATGYTDVDTSVYIQMVDGN